MYIKKDKEILNKPIPIGLHNLPTHSYASQILILLTSSD